MAGSSQNVASPPRLFTPGCSVSVAERDTRGCDDVQVSLVRSILGYRFAWGCEREAAMGPDDR